MILSSTALLVTLPSGNQAVYLVEPQHMNDLPGISLNQRAIQHGKQLAHAKDGRWYMPGGWDEITDLKTIALLERCTEA